MQHKGSDLEFSIGDLILVGPNRTESKITNLVHNIAKCTGLCRSATVATPFRYGKKNPRNNYAAWVDYFGAGMFPDRRLR